MDFVDNYVDYITTCSRIPKEVVIILLASIIACLILNFLLSSEHGGWNVHPIELNLLNHVVPLDSKWPSPHYARFMSDHGQLIPVHVLLDDLFNEKLQLRGLPWESLCEMFKVTDLNWSLELWKRIVRNRPGNSKSQPSEVLSPRLKQAYFLKYSSITRHLQLDHRQDKLAVSGSPGLRTYLKTYFDISCTDFRHVLEDHDDAKHGPCNYNYQNLVMVRSFNVRSSRFQKWLDKLAGNGRIIIETTVAVEFNPKVMWYAKYTSEYIDSSALYLLSDTIDSIKKYLLQHNLIIDTISDITFEEASITQAGSEVISGRHQMWKAWSSILYVEGYIRRLIFVAHQATAN
ncbi:hypothetical protein V1514DRAFT_323850 [Lipomyces japonicus]|uniref:uncharacterized protein n=1 Tax=Lipomyces japonicus TaxID=56871 RepID=UPI0034CE89E5